MYTNNDFLLILIAVLVVILVIAGTFAFHYFRLRNSCYDDPNPQCFTDWKCQGPAFRGGSEEGCVNGICPHPFAASGYKLPSACNVSADTQNNCACSCGWASFYSPQGGAPTTCTNTSSQNPCAPTNGGIGGP